MSFSKTISVVAALASIFGAATAGWKLAESNSQQPPTVLDEKLNQLDKKLEELSTQKPLEEVSQPQVTPSPQPVTIPPVQPLPPLPPQPEPQPNTFE
jgi:hypothetical protein